MQTPLLNVESNVDPVRWYRWSAVGRAVRGVVAASVLTAGAAHGHDGEDGGVPDAPGWRLGSSGALVYSRADDTWPTPRWPGVLNLGRSPNVLGEAIRLEHGVLQAAARLNSRLGAQLALGWHDREAMHVETAVLQAQQSGRWGELTARLGRDEVPMGETLAQAGHLDRFNQTPLVKRAVLNDDWIDDGLNLAWRPAQPGWLQQVDVGLWRGRVFPRRPCGACRAQRACAA